MTDFDPDSLSPEDRVLYDEEQSNEFDPYPLSVALHVMLERGHQIVDTEVGGRPEGPGDRWKRHQGMIDALQDHAREIDPQARVVTQPERSDWTGSFPEHWVIVWSGLTALDDIMVLRKHLYDHDYWVSEIGLHFEPAIG